MKCPPTDAATQSRDASSSHRELYPLGRPFPQINMDEESKDQPAAVEDGVSPDAAPTEEAEPEVEDIPDEDKEEVVEKIMTEDKEEVAETTYEASAAISEAPTDDAVAAPIEVVAAAPEEEEPPPYAAAASYSAPAKEKTSSSPFATADEGYWPAVEEGEMEVGN